MKKSQSVILSNEWMKKVLSELGIDMQRVCRVVIEGEVNQPLKIHIERFGTEDILDVPPLSRDFVELVDDEIPHG